MTGSFSQNVGNVFSKLLLVTDSVFFLSISSNRPTAVYKYIYSMHAAAIAQRCQLSRCNNINSCIFALEITSNDLGHTHSLPSVQ